MKFYRVLKAFQSPLVGNKMKGDTFQHGEESAKSWLKQGLIEEVVKESKPIEKVETESKPFKSGKKSKK